MVKLENKNNAEQNTNNGLQTTLVNEVGNLGSVTRTLMQRIMMVSIAIAITLTFAGIMSPVEVKAQPAPHPCPVDSDFPPSPYPFVPFDGLYQDTLITSDGCEITFNYCFRCDSIRVIQGAPQLTVIHYDAFISSIEYDGNCDFGSDTNYRAKYDSLYSWCMQKLIDLNPWVDCDGPGGLGIADKIPNCNDTTWPWSGWSKPIMRIGIPSCLAEYNIMTATGTTIVKIESCYRASFPVQSICWNTYKFCWQYDDNGGKELITEITDSGAPSTYACPGLFIPTDPRYVGPPVNCRAVCGD